MYRIGIDVGGSFTDCALLDEETGELRTAKVPSTPRDPATGFMQGLRTLCEENDAPFEAVVGMASGALSPRPSHPVPRRAGRS